MRSDKNFTFTKVTLPSADGKTKTTVNQYAPDLQIRGIKSKNL